MYSALELHYLDGARETQLGSDSLLKRTRSIKTEFQEMMGTQWVDFQDEALEKAIEMWEEG